MIRIIIALYLVLFTTLAFAQKPNVIIVMTDDQGYGELSCHGNPVLQTPNLDRLAEESIRFTDYHASPMCTPTRGQLMTGLDAARNGAINVSSGRCMLRADLPTMADYFSQAGFSTGLFGKWHLGDTYPYRPIDRGFQEAIWFPSSHINAIPNVWNSDYFDDTYWHNQEKEKFTGYCTDIFFTKAMTWMKEQADKDTPFLTYIPTNTPHGPLWAPEDDIKAMEDALAQSELAGIDPRLKEQLASYLGMVRNVDTNMGRLMNFLEAENLAENTILIFTTDNGSTFGWKYYNAGMRGKKRQVWEGGHRVPLFIRWPGGELGPSRKIKTLTQVQDILPTLLELCKIETETKFDGSSLIPLMTNNDAALEERMLVINYSRMPFRLDHPHPDSPSLMKKEGAVVLWKNWRLIYGDPGSASNGFQAEDYIILNNLDTDPLQEENVASAHPEIVSKMKDHLEEWWNGVKETVNEPQPVFIGSEHENPVMLTSCEWIDVFMDSQSQVRDGLPRNSHWNLYVDKPGTYEFELLRWPREANRSLAEGMPSTLVTAGQLKQGIALPIAMAEIQIGEKEMGQKLEESATKAVFKIELEEGPAILRTSFKDRQEKEICGAYYVYVRRE